MTATAFSFLNASVPRAAALAEWVVRLEGVFVGLCAPMPFGLVRGPGEFTLHSGIAAHRLLNAVRGTAATAGCGLTPEEVTLRLGRRLPRCGPSSAALPSGSALPAGATAAAGRPTT